MSFCGILRERNPFAILLDHLGHHVDELVDELATLLWRKRLPVVFDSYDHLADGFGQSFGNDLYEIGPDQLDRIQIVTSRRTLHPVDAGRLEELLGQLGRVFRIVVLMESVTFREVLRYERHNILEQYLQIHCRGQRTVEYLLWKNKKKTKIKYKLIETTKTNAKKMVT